MRNIGGGDMILFHGDMRRPMPNQEAGFFDMSFFS